jgi:iron complex outermembrane receptor protein
MSKSRYFCGGSILAVAMTLGAAGQAFAADEAKPTESIVEEVVVTGSFIAGTPEDTALPVDVIGAKELAQRGSPTMVQFIKTIPSSGAVIGENNRFGSGSGAATINLRNLSSPSTGTRTLVLFNGRRLPVSAQGLGSVDINLLPSAAIGRVEVLKDGAAATYGSDAIGGVVNFITRTDLQGFEIGANYQGIDGSDGDYDGSVAWGWKGDRANILLSAGYRHRSELSVKSRDWALRTGTTGYLQNPLGGWAGTGNPGQYQYAATAPVGSASTGFTSANFAGALPDIGCAANGGAPYILTTTIVSATSCNFQYTTFDNLVENEDHYQVYGQVNVDVTDAITAHVEALYAKHTTPLQSWAVTGPNQFPAPILASGASAGGGVSPIPASGTGEQSRFYIPNTNPGLVALLSQISAANCTGSVLPYGVDAATCATGLAAAKAGVTNAGLYGVATSNTAWRPIGFAGDPATEDMHSHYSYKTETWRISGGLKGKFGEGAGFLNGIGWDVALTYQEQDYNYNLEDVSVNRLQLGLRGYGSRAGNADQCTAAETNNFTTNAGNAALGCFYFNPFTNAMAQSQSNVPANPFYVATSAIPGFNDAAANRASVADWMIQKQYNEIQSHLFVVDAVFNGDTGIKLWGDDSIAWAAGAQFRYDRTQQTPDVAYDANATPCVDSPPFGDGSPFCPTTANGPFLFNANLRPYDVSRKISSVFGETKIPLTDTLELTLAARYEYYQGQGDTTNPKASLRWQATDWLAFRGSLGTTYRAPAATITTTNFTRGLTNANGTYKANDLYGNPNLSPETATTYDLGTIVEIGGFNATVDYWNFDFKDALTSEATVDLLNVMFPGGSNTGNCGNAAYAKVQARFTFDQGACSRANILAYRTQYINGGQVKTSGVDFQANLKVGEVLGGDLSTGFDGTYLLKYDEAPYLIEGFSSNAAGVQKRVGTYRASIFTGYNRIRANAFVNWASGIHNLRWQIRYISSVNQVETNSINIAAAVHSTTKVPEYWQHDITYKVELPWDTTAVLSIQNLFDKDPPFAIGTQYNYDPGSANPLGRVYSVGVKKRF